MRGALACVLLTLAGAAPGAAQNVLRPDATPGAPTLSATPEPMLPGGPTAYARRPGAYGPVTDLAYGAFQRGLYVTAFREASKRIESDPSDGAAMTLIGELYANGYGVRQDWTKAGEWYRLAAARGDAQGAFALAMLTLDGRGVTKDAAAGRRLLESAAPTTPAAAYNLGLLLLAENTPQSDARAIDLFRRAAEASEPEAQYAMGVLFKQGRAVQRDPAQAAMWLSLAAENHNGAAMVEYAIMLFNGEGVPRDETAGAKMFRRAAELGNPVAQNRLARIYAAGRGLPKDLVSAAKWHQLAAARGVADPWLDDALRALTPAERDRAEDAARRWLDGFG